MPFTLLIQADARQLPIPDRSVHCIITSPPYWSLRDYGLPPSIWGGSPDCIHDWSPPLKNHKGGPQGANGDRSDRDVSAQNAAQDTPAGMFCLRCNAWRGCLGLEPTPTLYVAHMVEVFRECRRVLRDDGTLWLNIGDSYATKPMGSSSTHDPKYPNGRNRRGNAPSGNRTNDPALIGCKSKDLVGIPWGLAKALRSPYYTGRIKSEGDRIWMAAILDAEGCISGFTHERKDGAGTRTGVNIAITNSSMLLLEKASVIWPARLFLHNKHGVGHLGKLDTYRWSVNGTENRIQFIREIYPYLVAKRKQAVLAYTLLLLVRDAKRLGKSPQAQETREKRARLISLISDANKARPVDVPSFCQEPPECTEPGWYLRQEIIWHKPNPMPASVTDRCTTAHESLFLLTKQPRYFFDADAIRTPVTSTGGNSIGAVAKKESGDFDGDANAKAGRGIRRLASADERNHPLGANKRSVWKIATQSFKEAHFATFPVKLVLPMIKAGTSEKGVCPACGAPWKRIAAVRYENPGN